MDTLILGHITITFDLKTFDGALLTFELPVYRDREWPDVEPTPATISAWLDARMRAGDYTITYTETTPPTTYRPNGRFRSKHT